MNTDKEPTCKEIADILVAAKKFIETICSKNDIRVTLIDELIKTFNLKRSSFSDYLYSLKMKKETKPKSSTAKISKNKDFILTDSAKSEFFNLRNGDFASKWIEDNGLTKEGVKQLTEEKMKFTKSASRKYMIEKIVDWFNFRRNAELDNAHE